MNEEEYETRIAELEQKLEEAIKANEENDFTELKTKYDNIIQDKNQEIENLKKEVENEKQKVNETVDTLQDEVQAKLDANEQYQKLLQTVEDLEKEKAETTVDTLIKQGKIVPAQRDIALDFCLNDAEKFSQYYENAKPVIDVTGEQVSKKTGKITEKLAGYF